MEKLEQALSNLIKREDVDFTITPSREIDGKFVYAVDATFSVDDESQTRDSYLGPIVDKEYFEELFFYRFEKQFNKNMKDNSYDFIAKGKDGKEYRVEVDLESFDLVANIYDADYDEYTGHYSVDGEVDIYVEFSIKSI